MVVVLSSVMIIFFGQRAKHELADAIEGNAITLLGATRNHVESMYNSILYHKSVMLTRRKIELKNNTNIAYAIINNAYQRYENGQISEDEAKRQTIADLRQVRYDEGVGYFWINDVTRPYPRMIMHPTIPELNGIILDDPEFDCALGKNENLFKAFVDICVEKEEGYVDYLWPKPTPEGLTEQQPKISYVKLFKPWDWIIGSGVYIDDIQNDVQNRIDAVIEDLNKVIIKQRIGESGYFLIFNDENYLLVHPHLAGTNGNQLVDPETGELILNELKKTASGPESYLEYMWDKPGYEGEYRFPKKTFITYYAPLGWYIGSSVYKEDFEEKISGLNKTIILFTGLFFRVIRLLSG